MPYAKLDAWLLMLDKPEINYLQSLLYLMTGFDSIICETKIQYLKCRQYTLHLSGFYFKSLYNCSTLWEKTPVNCHFEMGKTLEMHFISLFICLLSYNIEVLNYLQNFEMYWCPGRLNFCYSKPE